MDTTPTIPAPSNSANGARVHFARARKDGQPVKTRTGDYRLELDPKAGDVKTFGDRDNFYVPVLLPNGKTINFTLRSNTYTTEDVEGVAFVIRADAVTLPEVASPAAGGATLADSLAALAKAGDAAGLAALYGTLPGMTAKAAKAAASAAIKAAAGK